MKMSQKKKGQALIEFILVAVFVGLAFSAIMLTLNPQFFRNFFSGSISAQTGVDANGQMTMRRMGD